MAGRAAQETGVSAVTISRRFTRHGVPSMTLWQPSQRFATLSLMIVRIRTPMISTFPMVAGRCPGTGPSEHNPEPAAGTGRRPAEGALGAAPERPEAGRRPGTGPA